MRKRTADATRKPVWRGGPEVLIREGTDPDAVRLHQLLAGNQRVEYTCGYHWAVDFEYGVGSVETIVINEQCESFRRDRDEIWRILTASFKKAKAHPSPENA